MRRIATHLLLFVQFWVCVEWNRERSVQLTLHIIQRISARLDCGLLHQRRRDVVGEVRHGELRKDLLFVLVTVLFFVLSVDRALYS